MKHALIVDDHPVVRHGLKELLETTFPSLKVKTSAGGDGVIQEVCGTPWTFIVLDVKLPDASGLSVLHDIKACCPQIPIIVFSGHFERRYAARALRAGAIAYLSKGRAPHEVVELVRQILGGTKIQRPIAKQPTLSARELQVLTLLGKGMRRYEIAKKLKISEKTVSAHQANLLLKLDLRNLVELIRYAIEEGYAGDA
jgi:DNA-binding NarL/FixJ family response regulator